MSERPRIVITGMGWVTPLGHSLDEVWQRLLAGDSGVNRIERFDSSTFPTTFAAQVRGYDVDGFVRDPQRHATAQAHTRFALGAAKQAWDQSGLGSHDSLDRTRLGIYLGAGEGVLDFDNYAHAAVESWDAEQSRIDTVRWAAAAAKAIDGQGEVEQEPNMPAAHIADEFDVRGPVYNCLTACAASTQAVGEAIDLLRRGSVDVMISGGTHTMIHVLGITGFNRLTALSNLPAWRSRTRPFRETTCGR